MGFLGFSNGIRRRSIQKEESVFDQIDREHREKSMPKPIAPSFSGGIVKRERMANPLQIARERKREARSRYLNAVSTGDQEREQNELKNYNKASSQIKNVEKATKEKREEKFRTANSILGFAFSSKREYGKKPKKLRSKTVSGIYRSLFGR